MSSVFRLAAVAVAAAICALTVRKQVPEIAAAVSLCALAVLFFLGGGELHTVLGTVRDLGARAGLTAGLVEPLLRTLAAAIVTHLAASVSRDAGESAIAGAVETVGAAAALVLTLPLLESLLNLLEELMEI